MSDYRVGVSFVGRNPCFQDLKEIFRGKGYACEELEAKRGEAPLVSIHFVKDEDEGADTGAGSYSLASTHVEILGGEYKSQEGNPIDSEQIPKADLIKDPLVQFAQAYLNVHGFNTKISEV